MTKLCLTMNSTTIIASAIEEMNDLRDVDDQIDKSFSGTLIGPSGILDSLGTTTFILTVESKVQELHEKKVDIATILLSDEGINKDFDIKTIAALIDEQF